MSQNRTPDVFFNNARSRNRRVKSEVPDFFKEPSVSSLKKPESKRSHSRLHDSTFLRSGQKSEDLISKHREIILMLLKITTSLPETLASKLKDITFYPDILTDFIYRKLRGSSNEPSSSKKHIEEILEYQKYTTNLENQLTKVKQSNNELTSMILSVEVQQKLNKELNESISMMNSIIPQKPQKFIRKKVASVGRLEYDRILQAALKDPHAEGLKNLCEEVRRSLLADNVVVFRPNAQCTYFEGVINGQKVSISAKSTVLSMVFYTGESISAKIGDPGFDPRIQQMLKMKIKAFSTGLLQNHNGTKLGILLILRKRQELLFEKELNNLLIIFSLFITRWQLLDDLSLACSRYEHILESCSELLNSGTLQEFMNKLQNRLPSIFNCERGNVLLFDYEKNNLFRKLSERHYENFPIFHGLSGNCVNTKKCVISNEVSIDRMFYKEMDDPLGENTRSIISVPLFSKIFSGVPEAVIQLINKKEGAYFTHEDEEKIQNFAKMVTDCMVVLKYSRLSIALIEIIKKLEVSLEKMSDDMNERVYDFGFVKGTIAVFKSFVLKNFY